MKGWHKRYFLLERGILTYAKTGTDLKKGRLRGRIDVGLSVMAMKKKSMCIDLDTEDSIYHLKAKTRDLFEQWVTQLRHHRMFRQNEIAMEPPERQLQSDPTSNRRRLFLSKQPSALLKNSWCQNSQDMEKCCKDLSECESGLLELNLLLKNMEVLHRTFSAPAINLLQVGLFGLNMRLCFGLFMIFFFKKSYLGKKKVKHMNFLLIIFCIFCDQVSDDDSYISDVSDSTSVEYCRNENGITKEILSNGNDCTVTRRDRLPSSRMNESVNLWSILRSNIGKDLSKVAMPVQLNEPLNTLQRLCEEVEYCHLLDTAANTHDPHMRMVYIAAFAVSAYACSFTRAGGKPFNPILGETYECLRPDKGFRFIAEQVSHHPPVSTCHCESKNYTFWQDVRWKNKFWGKSMEIVPMGFTHLELPGSAPPPPPHRQSSKRDAFALRVRGLSGGEETFKCACSC
uniref:Oxysterol-binding protein n=1 Tax=Sinocyclocheilus grahami TaxID=75366 RepID=A0A672SKB6_SINGR